MLIADNDHDITHLLAKVLTSKGLNVECCFDGLTAREKLTNESFALFVCDLNMPGRTGFELIYDDVPLMTAPPGIIVISGYLEESGVDELRSAPNVLAVHRKPFDVLRFGDEVKALAAGAGA